MISRRHLIKLAGALAGAAATPLVACGPKRSADPILLDAAMGSRIDYRTAKAIPTICFGCTTHCGVIGWVQDGRVRKIEGNPLDPNTQGTICSKANGMISYTYYPERILYPLKRVGPRGGGQWQRVSWEEALTDIAAKMAALRTEGTPEKLIFHYGRDKTKGFTSRFTNAFGTPNRLNRRSICSSNRRVPLMSFYGREFEWESQDFENTKYILNFGGNPMEAYQGGQFMVKRMMDAIVDGGAKMITFEVRPSATASVSTEFHPVYPASDGAIALAMAHVILAEGLEDAAFWGEWVNVPLEEVRAHIAQYTPQWAEGVSGVSADDIRRIAIAFASAAPACTTLSNRGSAKHYNGVQNDRAIRMLDALVGNVGREGGFCLSTLRMWKNRYGQWGLPVIDQPAPAPGKLAPWKPGTREFDTLPPDVQERVAAFPDFWQDRYFGELATPSLYPLSWHWYNMRVGQLVYEYIREKRQEVGVYISYTLGASYGYPEAGAAREVLKDESLIPLHVAIDISYSEQASLADYILPDATSLERWDAHSTNSYSLRPYTGIRQPLVEPLGEARPVQIILRDLARRIGGGMEAHFDFEELEDYYRQWYSNLPISWEELKRTGIWQDEDRPLDYELHRRPVPPPELEGSTIDEATGVTTSAKGKTIGIMVRGRAVRGFATPTRKLQVFDPIFQAAAEATGLPLTDVNAQNLPTWGPVPEHVDLPEDRYVLTTFKWNVHTQGRSAYWKHQTEIVHDNPVYMHPDTAGDLGVSDGETVRLTVYRPRQHTWRAGEEAPVGTFTQRVKLLGGMHRKVVSVSHHLGHWEHGPVARADMDRTSPGAPGFATDGSTDDADVTQRVWWAKSRGGVGGGVHLNDALPINPTPLVGGQSWFDNVVSIEKVP
ncbi:MAG: thiosulfate reductase/polysulfide reductase chain A [Myxococcota bacterium]|jgi:thiosulfate reductase/polysulfide reductase chain A